MDIEDFKKRLKKYSKEDIIITKHADMQAFSRRIDLEEVKRNILNPERLVYCSKQETEITDEEKYECFFDIQKNLYHKYVIILNRKIIIVTIIAINRSSYSC